MPNFKLKIIAYAAKHTKYPDAHSRWWVDGDYISRRFDPRRWGGPLLFFEGSVLTPKTLGPPREGDVYV